MPILDVELIGQQESDPPVEQLAPRIAQEVGAALGVPEGQLWVKARRVAASSYAENGPRSDVLPIFVRVLVRTREPQVWPQRAAAISDAVANATSRPRGHIHIIFEPDATGRVFFGGLPDSRPG